MRAFLVALPPFGLLAGTALLIASAGARPGTADLSLYQTMGQMALDGNHPFAHPYADFPPAKMLLLGLLTATNGWNALSLASLIGGALLLRAWAGPRLAVWWSALSLWCGVALLVDGWYWQWEDKALYPVFLLGVWLAVRRERYVLAAGLAAGLQAYGGGGVFLLPILAWAARHQPRRVMVQGALLFGGLVLLAHLPWWPDGLAGYARRATRQSFPPMHESVWLWAAGHGLYAPWMAALAAGLTLMAAYGLLVRRWVSVEVALALAAFAPLGWGPEASMDRLWAGWLPLLWVGLHLVSQRVRPTRPWWARAWPASALRRRAAIPAPGS